MNDELERALAKRSKALAGATPIEQHIILLKLSELVENAPDLSTEPPAGNSPQRQWVAEVGALISKVSSQRKARFELAKGMLSGLWDMGIKDIHGMALDVIEELRLELELNGKADIGSTYTPGQEYEYFSDMKDILRGAESKIFIIDPYFDGEAFGNYVDSINSVIEVRILANRHAREVKAYVDKHHAQYDSDIKVKKRKDLHDRLVIIDDTDCWITGGSLNHGGKKSPAYLMPVNSDLAEQKLEIYDDIWNDTQDIADIDNTSE